jgi:hypothetical protein
MSANPFKDEQARRFENGAPHRGAGLDVNGLPSRDVKVRFNAWEVEQLKQVAQDECASFQRAIRLIVRRYLIDRQGKP